jgi:hypothetical protein
MKVSIDCDGTATRLPDFFVALGRALRKSGHQVYILTGIARSVFDSKRKRKYPHLADESWYDDVWTCDLYNDEERRMAAKVLCGEMDNHELVGQFKRRICREQGVAAHFDNDPEHVRRPGEVPVLGVKKQ